MLKRVPPKHWHVSDLESRTNNFCEGEINLRITTGSDSIFLQPCIINLTIVLTSITPIFVTLSLAYRRRNLPSVSKCCTSTVEPRKKVKDTSNIVTQRLKVLAERFDQEEIDLTEYLNGLSTLAAKDVKAKHWNSFALKTCLSFVPNSSSTVFKKMHSFRSLVFRVFANLFFR